MHGLSKLALATLVTAIAAHPSYPSPSAQPVPQAQPVQPAPPAQPAQPPPPATSPQTQANPIPAPAPGNAPKWTLQCQGGNYNGKRLDAVNGTIMVHTETQDEKNAAVIEFQPQQATGPFAGQIYYIDNTGALKYTNPGEQPQGTTSGFTNTVNSGSDQGELKYNGLTWAACPNNGYGADTQQVYAEVPGYDSGKQDCSCFKAITIPEKY